MIRKIYPLIAILTFLLVAFGFTLQRKPLFQKIVENVESKGRAFEQLTEVSETIGHRLTGSEQGKSAEEYVFRQLQKYKLDEVHYQGFEVNSWSRNTVKLSIVPAKSDNYRDVKCVTLAYSPQVADVAAEIIDCGDGLNDDFEELKGSLSGKIALFNVDIRNVKHKGVKNLHRSEKTALAIANGASGVILVNKVKNGVLLTGTASTDGNLIPIPAVCVSYETGGAIRRWIRDESNILAEISMTNYFKPARVRNVIATWPGKNPGKEKIVVGAHLDSWDLAQGAVDNGLGSFSILDIARVFSDLKLKTARPIEFVFFVGEEQGLLGSRHYVNELKKSNTTSQVALMVNLDMLNNCHGFNSFGVPEMQRIIEQTGNKIQSQIPVFPNQNKNAAGLHSDHQPFMLAGIPVCNPVGQLSEEALNCYHADCDKVNLIKKQEINENVKYVAMMLYELANSDRLPRHMNDLETRDYLIAQGLKNELILGKDWPWEN
jgi:Zn-dependent M28 family amino/carboxypeptidase